MFLMLSESVEAHQRSFDRGIQIGHQRRNKVRITQTSAFKNKMTTVAKLQMMMLLFCITGYVGLGKKAPENDPSGGSHQLFMWQSATAQK